MVSASCIQTLLMCAKAQEMRLILPDGFSIGYIWLGMRLHLQYPICVKEKLLKLAEATSLAAISGFTRGPLVRV